jgi:hypothetical protein
LFYFILKRKRICIFSSSFILISELARRRYGKYIRYAVGHPAAFELILTELAKILWFICFLKKDCWLAHADIWFWSFGLLEREPAVLAFESELHALYHACTIATTPRQAPPAAFAVSTRAAVSPR